MAPATLTHLGLLIVLLVASGLLPALFWLWFWLKEDQKKPEPTWLIARVFILGSLMVLPAYFIEKWISGGQVLSGNHLALGTLIGWAATEEILKYLAAYWGAFRQRYFDEPVDAMIYLITAALGFAAAENSLFILSTIRQQTLANWSFLVTGNFRFIGATVIHLVASALIGSLIGLTFYQPAKRQRAYTVLGLGLAIALHGLFNYTIIYQGAEQMMMAFVGVWLSAILIILLFERVKANIIKTKEERWHQN